MHHHLSVCNGGRKVLRKISTNEIIKQDRIIRFMQRNTAHILVVTAKEKN